MQSSGDARSAAATSRMITIGKDTGNDNISQFRLKDSNAANGPRKATGKSHKNAKGSTACMSHGTLMQVAAPSCRRSSSATSTSEWGGLFPTTSPATDSSPPTFIYTFGVKTPISQSRADSTKKSSWN